ncbi:MAG: phosphoenolpyruvate carboxylase [Pseudomonadota bacterium]
MEPRDVSFPPKDEQLRSDVSTLGALVGEVVAEQCGAELFDHVEAVRRAAIERRQGEDNRLADVLSEVPPGQLRALVRAFTEYFHLVNLTEIVHRVRRRRDYQREADRPQPESLADVVGQVVAAGVDWPALERQLCTMVYEPVFTAHPTESVRRTILEKEQEIVRLLLQRIDPDRSPVDERRILDQIRALVTSAWQTNLHPHVRQTVADEMEHVLFYLTDVIYRVVPAFYDELRDALKPHFPQQSEDLRMPVMLRFGSWVGGDMDGNPNVGAHTIRETLAQHRRWIIERYLQDVHALARALSQSIREVDVASSVMHRLERYERLFPDVAASVPDRLQDMPYRRLLTLVAARLEATLADADDAYHSGAEFANDLQLIRSSLEENRGRHAGMAAVRRLQQRARTFGFHLATLDFRQDSLVHRQAVAALLGDSGWMKRDAETRTEVLTRVLEETGPLEYGRSKSLEATLDVFRAVAEGRTAYGTNAIGLAIISMTQGADDVLSVLLLAREAGLADENGQIPLDVSPLLETVDDLNAGPEIFEALLTNPVYARHLAARDRRQIVMIGYSDSNKDGGIVAARWALRQAEENIVAVGDDHGIEMGFFHGRGGTVSRGGGNTRAAIAAAPAGSVSRYLRVTEQGEVIHRKYAFRDIALRNLEQSASAMLLAEFRPPSEDPDQHRWQEIMALIATESRRSYRALVHETPEFVDYFRSATPIDVIERLGLGSRPASRRSGQGISNLRAIPWVFAWGQTRTGLPGIYGLGSGVEAAVARFGETALRLMLRASPLFSSMINDVEMVLAKSDRNISRAYSELAPEGARFVFERIDAEMSRTERWILALKQSGELLDDQPVLQRSIRLRNPYVDPMNFVQIRLLDEWRATDCKDDGLLATLFTTVNGIARGIQNTG